MTDFFVKRRSYSERKIAEIRQWIEVSLIPSKAPLLSIYATGSYGRLEASEHSDIDVFLVHDGYEIDTPLTNMDAILVKAELIKMVNQLGFKPFSNDAQYLNVHALSSILDELGGRQDDYHNYFTARMLLLLESRSLYGDTVYHHIIDTIIESYYRDYSDHKSNFQPIFLLNDIQRFWKTLCTNYEYRRNQGAADEEEKAKRRIQNLQLKYSRLLTCFSTIIPIATGKYGDPDALKNLVALPPLERLQEAASKGTTQQKSKAVDQLAGLRSSYRWFLDMTARPDRLEWAKDDANWEQGRAQAEAFGEAVDELFKTLAEGTPGFRYALI